MSLKTSINNWCFSNFGGALAEINLPFEDNNDKKSAVKEIEFDRDMVKEHPQNAHFLPTLIISLATSQMSLYLEKRQSLEGIIRS